MRKKSSEAPPIACTLSAANYEERRATIADLNRDTLRSHRRDGLCLELIYDPTEGQRVRDMVRREQECCAFLTFELHEDVDRVRLRITAPDDARESADVLFEEFQSSSRRQSGCACERRVTKQDVSSPGRRVGVTATAVATGALACGALCLIPVALPAVALTGVGGVLAWFAGKHAWVTGAALAIVGAGWIQIWRQSTRTRSRPRKSTFLTMGIATAILAMAFSWPAIEPYVLRMIEQK